MTILEQCQGAAVVERGHVGVLTLNRPDQRNAMTPELLGDFAVAVERAKADRGARAVVLVGDLSTVARVDLTAKVILTYG